MLKPGAVVADKYRIERVLGKGGMGAVFAARHNQLGTMVALKFLHESMTKHPKVIERFLREARASAQLRGEHICRVSDVGTSDGKPYLVMELLEGSDLAKLLKKEGRLPVAFASDYVLQACAGIAEAHSVGIVHRDLKPGNLFLTKRPDGSPLVKVLDFGVAKAPEGQAFDLTQTTTVLGSPGYMSPEQLRSSKVVDARADVWALGAILFELLAGRPPFVADSLTELALKIAMDPTPTLPGKAPGLDAVIARCLQKEPRDRFDNVGELAEALAPFASPEQRATAIAVKGVLAQGSSELPTKQMPVAQPIVDHGSSEAETSGTSVTTLGRATGELDEPGRKHAARSRGPKLAALGVTIAAGTVFAIYMGQRSTAPIASSASRDAAAPAIVETHDQAPRDAAPANVEKHDQVPRDAGVVVVEKHDEVPPDAAPPASTTAAIPDAGVPVSIAPVHKAQPVRVRRGNAAHDATPSPQGSATTPTDEDPYASMRK